jgi:NSS family neurotransmitter:Na+ symporter
MARIMQQNQCMSIAERYTSGVWGSRTTFLLALTASAIGLGNLWRFPYLLGEHGGAPFLLTYLACLFLVAVPVLIAEIVIGSHGRSNPVSALLHASDRSEISRAWVVVGWLAGLTATLVLAYYCVVAGWSLAYIDKMASGVFADASANEVGLQFQALLQSPRTLVVWQTFFILLVFTISALGIYQGLGLLFWLVVPLMLVSLGVLINYGLEHGDMVRTGQFLFSFNSYDFTAESVLVAMGHALYTLGIGLGVGMVFGAYSPAKLPIGRTVLAVAMIDTMVALAAGLAIFPIIFASNMQPTMGPALMFVGLPYAFGNMVEGELFGSLFFLMVSVVSLGSAVALAEPMVTYMQQRMLLSRSLSALVCAGATSILSLGCALSFNIWQDMHWYADYTLFELLDQATVLVMLPLTALLTALLVGYGFRREVLMIELYRESRYFYLLWRFCLRYIAPPAILVVMLAAVVEMN